MDSLTQIVLGAAVGEATLGRKIGNRAMIWGAIGGTIPDLDILANPFLTDLEALAFHRGITHSILFSVVAPFLFGWLVHRLYDSRFHKSKFYKGLISLIQVAFLVSGAYGLIMLFTGDDGPIWWAILIVVSLASYLLFRLVKYYWLKDLEEPQVSFKAWYILFFLAFFTHILLDSFTAYGTQVFQPFSDYRLAFNNISVADPAYTFPFLICVVVAAFYNRNSRARYVWNWIGIGISSAYMILTIFTKLHVDRVFENALAHREIDAIRCRTSPTILNNILWACVAEDRDHFYIGQYSLFDSNPNLHYLNVLPKQDSIMQVLAPYEDFQTLKWFADGYLTAMPTDSIIYLCDIRYGAMGDTVRDQRDFVFYFTAREEQGKYVFAENREPPTGEMGEMFRQLITRIKGY